jgi:K(+)-stimulated pyrophosphate-energized sodium pump
VAFSGGAVMGMCVVGLGLTAMALALLVLLRKFGGGRRRHQGTGCRSDGLSMAASSIALFARVGGGIYTRRPNVGADLVGKVEAGIPEDDPRIPPSSPKTWADNVGDVGRHGRRPVRILRGRHRGGPWCWAPPSRSTAP